MNIIYCDGSLKKDNTIVVGIIVVRVEPVYHSVREIILAYKNVFEIKESERKDNLHETLAILEAMNVANMLDYKSTLIVNDSIADVLYFQKLQNKEENIKDKTINVDVLSLYNRISSRLKQDSFQRLPRTSLGLNIADYLNKETYTWTNSKDKPYLTLQFKKLLKRAYDYDISSKNKNVCSIL